MNLKAQRVGCEVTRNRHYDRAVVQRQRSLSVVAVIGGSVTAGFGVMQLIFSNGFGYIGFVNLGTVALYAVIPSLYRFGELVAPLGCVAVRRQRNWPGSGRGYVDAWASPLLG